MYSGEAKVSFFKSLTVLHKLFYYLGIANCTYNRATKRFQISKLRQCISFCVLVLWGLRNLGYAVFLIGIMIFFYVTTEDNPFIKKEALLYDSQYPVSLLNTFALAVNYIVYRKAFVEILNRIITIFECIQKFTNADLYYRSSFRKLIITRVLFYSLTGLHNIYYSEDFIDGIMVYVHNIAECALVELTFWLYVYANATLMCFYEKMNESLHVLWLMSSKRKIKRRIRKMISISYEIHRVKEKLNIASNCFQAVLFSGFFGDIFCFYGLLKYLVACKTDKMVISRWTLFKGIFSIIFQRIWAAHNWYVNNQVAGGTIQAEDKFRQKLFSMYNTYDFLREDPAVHQQEFLSKNKVVHRDLAARNILVSSDRTVKIADFGLSRDVYQENIYKKTGTGKLPIKWLALESMTHQVYTSQSDVWSYGILLYEIITLGGIPYPSIPTHRLLHLLKTGYRMEKPMSCSSEFYSLMLSCWHANPSERPNFAEIIKILDCLLNDSTQLEIEQILPPKLNESLDTTTTSDDSYLKPL